MEFLLNQGKDNITRRSIKQSYYIWQPKPCHFSNCKLYNLNESDTNLNIFDMSENEGKNNTSAYYYRVNTSDIYNTTSYQLGCNVEEDPSIIIYGKVFNVNITVDCANPSIYESKVGPMLREFLFKGDDFRVEKENVLDARNYILPPHPICKFKDCLFYWYSKKEDDEKFIKISGGSYAENFSLSFDTNLVHPPSKEYFELRCEIDGGIMKESRPIEAAIEEDLDPAETVSSFQWKIHVDHTTCLVANTKNNKLESRPCSEGGPKSNDQRATYQDYWSYNLRLKYLYVTNVGLRLDY